MANRLELGEIVGPSEQGSTAGEDGFFDDFKAVPAFEAAVVFTFGRFTLSFFFGVSLRFMLVVSRGGVELSRGESFDEELELGKPDFFAFGTAEELNQSIYFLRQ
jgi:hypothetical protein